MKSYKLGELIEPFFQACGIPDLKLEDVSGINRDKEFFEPAKQVGEDTSSYQIVPKGYFACNLMHVGRDVVLPISCNHSDKDKIVSPAYTVFYIKDENIILKEYFFMMLKSDEKDRFFWFHTDSSVRDGMSWEDFTSLEISLPSIDIQKKYVDVYKSMQSNLSIYQKKIDDLKLVCDGYLDKLKNESNKLMIGDCLSEFDIRNSKGIKNVLGLNIEKQFMPTVANIQNVNLENYKLVEKGTFVFSGMQTGRDNVIRISLYKDEQPGIISPAYSLMQVINPKIVPEYLMLWFTRKEVDRYGSFVSDGSIRANLDLERFYDITIPVPEINIQKSIVQIYNAYQKRKAIADKLKAQINSICPILIRGSIKEGE